MKNLIFIPLARNSKKPLAGGDWHNLLTDDETVWSTWLSKWLNLGMPLEENMRVVVDFDEKDAAREFWKKHRDLCTVVVETRRGAHVHFSGATQTRKFEHGDIKGNGYVLYPPSEIDGFVYRHVAEGFLQPFPEHLFPRKAVMSPVIGKSITGEIRDIRAYIRKIPSIAGQHGHDACFRVACVLRDAGFSEIDALTELMDWNVECAQPQWSVRELSKKVKDAFRVVLKGG